MTNQQCKTTREVKCSRFEECGNVYRGDYEFGLAGYLCEDCDFGLTRSNQTRKIKMNTWNRIISYIKGLHYRFRRNTKKSQIDQWKSLSEFWRSQCMDRRDEVAELKRVNKILSDKENKNG